MGGGGDEGRREPPAAQALARAHRARPQEPLQRALPQAREGERRDQAGSEEARREGVGEARPAGPEAGEGREREGWRTRDGGAALRGQLLSVSTCERGVRARLW